MTAVRDDIDGFYDVGMLQGRTDAELGGDLLLVFLFALACPLGAEFLDSKDGASVLRAGLYQTDGATGTRT